jgi:hypothetical protein
MAVSRVDEEAQDTAEVVEVRTPSIRAAQWSFGHEAGPSHPPVRILPDSVMNVRLCTTARRTFLVIVGSTSDASPTVREAPMQNRRRFIQSALVGSGLVALPDIAGRLTGQRVATRPKPPYLKTPFLKNGTCPDLTIERARFADPPTEADLIKKLYSKIEDSFSLGANAPYPGHAFLILCNPGIFIDPNLNLAKRADRSRLSDVLNSVPESSFAFIFQDTGVRVQSVYDQIIRNHLTATYQLTTVQKQQLRDAEAILKDSAKMNDYFKYQGLYATAADKLANARANEQNGGPSVDPQLIVAFNKAKHDFQINGHQYQVSCAQEIYDQLLGGDPTQWWHDVRQRYDADPDKLVDVYPTYADWMSGSGWDSRTMQSAEWANQSENSSTDVGGGFGVGWGLWRVGADANYHQDQGFEHSQAQNVDLKFEAMRANIIRDWLEPLVFKSRNWIWNQPQTDISSGGNAPSGITPTGLMPFYPTGVLLARNIELTASFSQADKSWMNKVIDGSTSVGWGPFSFSGHYHHEEHSQLSSGSVVGATIKTKPGDVQVLGFFCDVLPHCPDRNPDLHWPPGHVTTA